MLCISYDLVTTGEKSLPFALLICDEGVKQLSITPQFYKGGYIWFQCTIMFLGAFKRPFKSSPNSQ